MATASTVLGPGPAPFANMPLPNPPASTSRKRSRSMIFQDDGEEEYEYWNRTNGGGSGGSSSDNAAASSSNNGGGDELKRTRTQGDLDTLGVVPPSEAWQLQPVAADLLASAASMSPNGLRNYVPGRSLLVLCVLEHVDIQYRLLCAALPYLQHISPSLQPLLLCRDPSAVLPHLRPPLPASTSFPAVAAKGHPQNHFLKLGLLHPLGGGQAAMDALVVLDPAGRRRVVLPFGWGPGRHVQNTVGGDMVQERLMEVLREGVEVLERELR